MATGHEATVQWNGVAIGKVANVDPRDAYAQVNCSCLDSVQEDNRPGLLDPSGNIDISLKDNNTPPMVLDDVGTLTVDGFARKVRISEVGRSRTVNGHRVDSFSFVSTEEGT